MTTGLRFGGFKLQGPPAQAGSHGRPEQRPTGARGDSIGVQLMGRHVLSNHPCAQAHARQLARWTFEGPTCSKCSARLCLEQTPAVKRDESGASIAVSTAPVAARAHPGTIELKVAGLRLCLRGEVDETSVCSVLRALRQTA